MKKVRDFSLTACVFAMLASACDYPVVTITHADSSYRHTTRRFKFEAMIPNDAGNPNKCVAELQKDGMSSYLSLFCMEGSSNLFSPVMLELIHTETGDPEHPEIEGSLLISADRENFLYGVYNSSSTRAVNPDDFSCRITTGLSSGIFYTEKTELNLCIKGISERGNTDLIAYNITIEGYLRKP